MEKKLSSTKRISNLSLTDSEWEQEILRGLPSQWARRLPFKTPQPKGTAQPSCSAFLPANPSKNYEDYVAAPTTGRMTLMINGRNSGGPGPHVDLAEAFPPCRKQSNL